MSPDDLPLDKIRQIAEVFTPSSPVSRAALFRGRVDLLMDALTALGDPGRHVVLYGERGVGKTSLANILMEMGLAGEAKPQAIRVNCTSQDDFRTIWEKVLRGFQIEIPEGWKYDPPDPDTIRVLLEEEGPARSVVVIDEFDRIEDDDSLSLMADSIKALSDYGTKIKLLLVGVGDSIGDLIGEHASVQRSFEELLVPRMEESELYEIIDSGLLMLEMTIKPVARTRVARLAEGLPHYVHLLMQYGARAAVMGNRTCVEVDDIDEAIRKATEKHSLMAEYELATRSPRRDNLFGDVLLAAALAPKNKLGFFTPASVSDPMSAIKGRRYDVPAFSRHLRRFAEIERGCVLQEEGPERKHVYRFRNPLLQPFTILQALGNGTLPEPYKSNFSG